MENTTKSAHEIRYRGGWVYITLGPITDNFDCSACGRLNQPRAIYFSDIDDKPTGRYCDACVDTFTTDEELAALEAALQRH